MAERLPLPVTQPEARLPPNEKVKTFPQTPGVYLMKDARGDTIYIGKAKNLRSRASSYFLKEAAENLRTCELVQHIRDIDFIPCETEVDALLYEARLVKNLQPKFNRDLKDDKTFPYLQIRVREEYPRVEITRNPRRKGVKLYGPFTSARTLRDMVQVLQRVLKFRNCSLDIKGDDDRWRYYRPCILHSICQCSAPCNFRVTKDEYRKQVRKLMLILGGKKARMMREMKAQMVEASLGTQYEKAARIRDEMVAMGKLSLRGDVDKDAQTHACPIDPKKGLAELKKVLGLEKTPRTVECFDIAHLGGQDTVASLVAFIDGVPFKAGYRRYKVKSVIGVDDFASMREVITRRFKRLSDEGDVFPDILLIDGGKGQLSAALDAFKMLGIEPPTLLSLAKQEEEIFRPGLSESLKLSRHSGALRLLQYARDEAHRFAQHYHHTLRAKRMTEK